MEEYRIKKAYPFDIKGNEIEIISKNLIYCELENLSGVQCINLENQDIIRKKCNQIADLIREIEKLNKI